MRHERQTDLIALLRCPDCRSDLGESTEDLACSGCGRPFEVRNGVPVLLPSDCDEEHLREEERLADHMAARRVSGHATFLAEQGRESKREFWSRVAQSIGPPPRTLLNVGSGYDPGFRQFQDAGHLFVNFDLVSKPLESLKLELGAQHCVAGDANRLPFKPGSFDYLTCIDTIHHEGERLMPLLAAFHDLLKPGGALFLEDVNAWAMFQFPKSMLLPRPVYRRLRAICGDCLTHRDCRLADYEFPTNPFKVKRILDHVGFSRIVFFKTYAYLVRHESLFKIYRFFSRSDRIARFHNYHYMLMAVRSD